MFIGECPCTEGMTNTNLTNSSVCKCHSCFGDFVDIRPGWDGVNDGDDADETEKAE